MIASHRIVLASPHARHDELERDLRQTPGLDVLRIRKREDLTLPTIKAFGAEKIFFAHWSWKIEAEIYSRIECVIFHMTDVPFGRGGSPLQNLIVRGFDRTVLSALRCEEAVDAGPVYLKRPLSLMGTAEEILARAAGLMREMIPVIALQDIVPIAQQGEVVSFSRRTPAEGNLAGVRDLLQFYDMVRMLDGEGYPPAFLDLGQFRIEFTGAELEGAELRAGVRVRVLDGDSK